MIEPDETHYEAVALTRLSGLLLELAARVDHHPPVTVTPNRLVELVAQCVPRSEHVAILVGDQDVEQGVGRCVAATSVVAEWVGRIRADTGQGPQLSMVADANLVVSNDLPAEPRWPVFGTQVCELAGIRSLMLHRLAYSPREVAALCFYSSWPHAFDGLTIAVAAISAAYASLTLEPGCLRNHSGADHPTSRGATAREQTTAVRERARRDGHQVSDRGRIPTAGQEAFNTAH